ncbi:hypothetical protein P3339_09295 [Microbulbifer sp. MLAF003]|uniref:hypothetical protein n=1 Tax=unclassified Microbulbifer TaxID=2619833 RepID=UPI0024AE0904|nr:hypothetical protein [Microbulbifer sp. MLAF003]WHI52936.1 hypothetical protein P3339_09295 [Microbulbifer sp. MLAF003]
MFVISGCLSHEEREYQAYIREYNRIIANPAPSTWKLDTPWSLVLLDESSKIVETMQVEFTSLAAKTCTSGDWRRLRVIEANSEVQAIANSGFIPEPAYTLTGSYLVIDLNANICDAGNELRGEITELGISGTRQTVHMFGGEKLGRFVGIRVGS